MKVFEFAGLPGAGKSTICSEWVRVLLEEGYEVYNYSDMTKDASTKKRRLLFYVRLLFRLDLYQLYKSVNLYAENYHDVSKQTKLIFICLFANLKRLEKREKNTLCILDEGFVQNLTSFAHTEELIKDHNYYKIIHEIKKRCNVHIIDCYLPVEKVSERLRYRGRRDRFNMVIDDEVLEAILLQKRKNLNRVIEDFDVKVSLNLTSSPEEILCALINEMEGIF